MILPLTATALGCAITLAGVHVGLWQFQAHVPRTATYVIGVACIGVWFSLWSVLAEMPVAAVGFWAVAGAGGASVITCYWIRGVAEQHGTALFQAGAAHEQANSTPAEAATDHRG